MPVKSWRRHADDGDHLAVDRHDAIDRRRLAGEPLLPVGMADDRDGRRAQPVVAFDEHAAQGRRDAEHREVVAGGLIAAAELRVAVHDDVHAHRRARGQAGQGRVRGPKLLEHGERERRPDVPRAGRARVAVVARAPHHVVLAGRVEPDETVGLADGHGLQEQAVDGGEQRRVRADAERKRDEDDERPALGVEEDADGEAQVPEQRGHESPFGGAITLPRPASSIRRAVASGPGYDGRASRATDDAPRVLRPRRAALLGRVRPAGGRCAVTSARPGCRAPKDDRRPAARP